MKYQAIIFDLDGTLLNTLEDLTDGINVAMNKFGLEEKTLEEIVESGSKEDLDQYYSYLESMKTSAFYKDIVERYEGLSIAEITYKIMEEEQEFISDYLTLSYLDENGNVNGIIQPELTTKVLVKHGFKLYQNEKQQVENFTIFPIDYFCPYDTRVNKMKITPNTYSIHYYNASWYTEEQKKARKILTRRRKLERIIGKRLYKLWESIRSILFEGGLKSILKSKFKTKVDQYEK